VSFNLAHSVYLSAIANLHLLTYFLLTFYLLAECNYRMLPHMPMHTYFVNTGLMNVEFELDS